MGFVKLDSRILNSTLWVDKDGRDLFITGLLMAKPWEFTEPQEQLEVRSLNKTGFIVPPGWYGFIPCAGIGIIRQSLVETEDGYKALEALGNPDPESRTKDFDGRRMVRVDGGYIILNYMKYRDFDHTAKERQRRLRERKKGVTDNTEPVTRDNRDVTRDVTHSREQKAESRKHTASSLGAAVPSAIAVPSVAASSAATSDDIFDDSDASSEPLGTAVAAAIADPLVAASPQSDQQIQIKQMAGFFEPLIGIKQNLDFGPVELKKFPILLKQTPIEVKKAFQWALNDPWWKAQMLDEAEGRDAMKVLVRGFPTLWEQCNRKGKWKGAVA